MYHFVIKDANPAALKESGVLVEILNDSVMLITAANGPVLTKSILRKETDKISFQEREGNYEVDFQSILSNDQLNTGKFLLREDGALIMELAFTVHENKPSDVRVKLNCEGERLVREELERAFERDYSFEAGQLMERGAEEKSEKNNSRESDKLLPEGTEIQNREDADNFELELNKLSESLLEDLTSPDLMLERFSNICHDIFRGAVGDFSTQKISEEVIENGAKIQYVDYELEDYYVTFRSGELEDETEVSFFLEQEDELIFSVHLSTEGYGSVAAADEVVARKVVRQLI